MKTITQAINRYKMLVPGERVIVGFSGGADSTALLYFLYRYGAAVSAVHVNHMLRGGESMRDEQFVRDFCKRYDIPLTVHRVEVDKIAKEKKIGLEEAGREVRYGIFAEEAAGLHAKIATAHTLSDQAETILYRLARGSGMKGLCGIPPVRMTEDGIMIIRPLLETSRDQVEDYCRREGLSYVTDSSNFREEYARNIIRLRVIPGLEQVNAAAQLHLEAFSRSAAADEDYLSAEAEREYESCSISGGLNAEKLLLLHPAMQTRVAGQFLKQNGIFVERQSLSRILELAERHNRPQPDKRYGAVSLPGGRECVLRSGRLSVIHRQEADIFPGQLLLDEENQFTMPSGKVWKFLITLTKPTQIVHKNTYYFCADYDKIKGVINCRSRMPGDCLKIAFRNITRTVKKWMNEENVPVDEREKLFVLADEEGVFMVESLGLSARVVPDDTTKRFLIITCMNYAG